MENSESIVKTHLKKLVLQCDKIYIYLVRNDMIDNDLESNMANSYKCLLSVKTDLKDISIETIRARGADCYSQNALDILTDSPNWLSNQKKTVLSFDNTRKINLSYFYCAATKVQDSILAKGSAADDPLPDYNDKTKRHFYFPELLRLYLYRFFRDICGSAVDRKKINMNVVKLEKYIGIEKNIKQENDGLGNILGSMINNLGINTPNTLCKDLPKVLSSIGKVREEIFKKKSTRDLFNTIKNNIGNSGKPSDVITTLIGNKDCQDKFKEFISDTGVLLMDVVGQATGEGVGQIEPLIVVEGNEQEAPPQQTTFIEPIDE